MSKRIVYDTANVLDQDFAMPVEEVRGDIDDEGESAMSTVSKLAEEITGALSGFGHLSATVVDAELAPVRECLEGLRRGPCWCGYVGHVHTAACLAAQQLWERLKIQ